MATNFMDLMEFDEAPVQVSQPLSEEDKWVRVLNGITIDKDAKHKWEWFAAGILVATGSSKMRNAAALALADMGAQVAGGSIVEVLRRPEVAKVSGTLLYALRELKASIPLSVLIGIIENGSYEGRATALMFFEENRIEQPSNVELDDARKRLASLATREDDREATEVARLALEYIEDKDRTGNE